MSTPHETSASAIKFILRTTEPRAASESQLPLPTSLYIIDRWMNEITSAYGAFCHQWKSTFRYRYQYLCSMHASRIPYIFFFSVGCWLE